MQYPEQRSLILVLLPSKYMLNLELLSWYHLQKLHCVCTSIMMPTTFKKYILYVCVHARLRGCTHSCTCARRDILFHVVFSFM